MQNSIAGIIVGAICSLGVGTAQAQNDEEEQGRKIAEEAIKAGAVDYLTDREFKLDGPQLVASARAIDPKEHVKIELREFELLLGRADLKVKINALFRFDGRVAVDDKRIDVRGEATIGQIVTIEAKYWVDDRGLHIDARATELKFSARCASLRRKTRRAANGPSQNLLSPNLPGSATSCCGTSTTGRRNISGSCVRRWVPLALPVHSFAKASQSVVPLQRSSIFRSSTSWFVLKRAPITPGSSPISTGKASGTPLNRDKNRLSRFYSDTDPSLSSAKFGPGPPARRELSL
ncbi:MAG TPA: hypothetical protein VGK58_05895 [Lacipirellulaceae bacterium]